ncbi:MAG: sugar phosphate isomerase/epimerase family protein [Bacillota bacterium]
MVGAAAAYGLEGIDLRGLGPEIDVTRLRIFGDELPASLDLLRRHGLEMPCFNTSIVLVTPAGERWEMMLAECQRYAQLAQRTGTRYLRIFGGAATKHMARGEATLLARRHLRQLEKLCTPYRCQVLLETHDDWATSEQILELIQGFTPEEVGVLWDFEHPYRRGESPGQTAGALRTHIRHIHIKDSLRKGDKSTPCLLGEGELPLGEMIQAVRSIGYNDWICLETEKRWHPETAPEPEQSLPRFVRYMRENGKAGKLVQRP